MKNPNRKSGNSILVLVEVAQWNRTKICSRYINILLRYDYLQKQLGHLNYKATVRSFLPLVIFSLGTVDLCINMVIITEN
jgi:hypothetical protein